MLSYQELTNDLEFYHKERIKVRKKLFKFLRENRYYFRTDTWLIRKMNNNWLGDLTDGYLIKYSREILNQ